MEKSKNSNLNNAKKAKNDEFYTQFSDVEREINCYLDYNSEIFVDKVIHCPCDAEWSNFSHFFANNFARLGLKALIMTCYNANGKGLYAIVNKDFNKDGVINIKDVEFKELQGDGDFRSEEIKNAMRKADYIFTNPPFSLFREFIEVMVELDKKFSIIGSQNAITYKNVFPLIKENKLWLGASIKSGDTTFRVPDYYENNSKNYSVKNDIPYVKVTGIRWFTNIPHGRLYYSQKDWYMTMADNLKFNKKISAYNKYDNYDAINVDSSDGIPRDYDGVMGVPITFLDKYNPNLFEILGCDYDVKEGLLDNIKTNGWEGKFDRGYINGKRLYSRILIKWKN